jgi:diacylglycerol O-acyltransferase
MAQTDGDRLRFDDRMSDLEALLWSLEAHQPRFRATITVVVSFDRPPDPVAVRDRVDRLSRRLPRLRDRVAAGPLATAPPRWEPDPDFDLDRHLITVPAASPVSLDDALRAAQPVAAGPFARDHPLWQMLLIRSVDGAGALIIKLHHTLTDGLGVVKLATEMFDLDRVAPPDPSAVGLPEPNPPSPLGRMWEDLTFEAGRTIDLVRRVVPWAMNGLRDAALDPGPRAEATYELVQSLRAMAAAAAGSGSPILAGRSTGARFGVVAFPLDDARRAARRAGGTVNDVFLAGVLGGLRQYHAKRDSRPPSLRLGIPVSTRQAATDAHMRNQFAPLLLRAPLQLADPVERIRLLHDLVEVARHQSAFDLLEQATGVLRRTPGSLGLIARLLAAPDVLASNVPGSPVDLYLGGAKVVDIVPLGPRGGTGLNLTLLSHVDTIRIGLNMDPVTIPEPTVLIDCLRSGFDETLA